VVFGASQRKKKTLKNVHLKKCKFSQFYFE